MTERLQAIISHQQALSGCRMCPEMQGPVVMGAPVASPVLLVGQAPGDKEILQGRPFCWTAGKTLFGWFGTIGLDEQIFRRCVYMSAVCRCFPGKLAKGGDRPPGRVEVKNCAAWLTAEISLLKPRLILPVGKLAISRFVECKKLDQVVGKMLRIEHNGLGIDVIPLPHPSGASVWHRREQGKILLNKALALIQRHSAWRQISDQAMPLPMRGKSMSSLT